MLLLVVVRESVQFPLTQRTQVSTSEPTEATSEGMRNQSAAIGTADRVDVAREPGPVGSIAPTPDRGAAFQHALLSAFIPGAAQLVQGRWVAGLAQCAVVVAYLAGVFAAGPTQAVWLAIVWNAYSAVDAYWYERN